MEPKKKRVTFDLDAEVQQRLKAIAALKGISMRQYCQNAIETELAKESAASAPTENSGASRADSFKALRREIFGDRVLPGNSADLIRESREMRDEQLKDIM